MHFAVVAMLMTCLCNCGATRECFKDVCMGAQIGMSSNKSLVSMPLLWVRMAIICVTPRLLSPMKLMLRMICVPLERKFEAWSKFTPTSSKVAQETA
ncbi:hypothetical protein HPP92_026491 [Vanilla planifolia]|uniref:Secreted protein n=1 Tax=Vanilla planifolia TaxID=51239 RepID=A0A835PCV4_VANPL|nr:hypothetical protein HPP92_026491 [Vanilla planifolia]